MSKLASYETTENQFQTNVLYEITDAQTEQNCDRGTALERSVEEYGVGVWVGVSKQSKGFKGDLKLKHKATTNRSTMEPITDRIDGQAPTI